MNIKLTLTLALSTGLLMTGCSETKTFGTNVVNTAGSAISNAVSETINGFMNGTTEASSNRKTSQTKNLPAEDMVYLFGWMEDGCIGDSPVYNSIKEANDDFINKTMKVKTLEEPNRNDEIYEFFITPRSQWSSGYSPLIQDIIIQTNYEYTEYHIKFVNGVEYRGEPIEEYHYKFRPESEGGEYVLKLAKNADIQNILERFKTRQVFDYVTEEMFNNKAKYDLNSKTLTCYY